MVAPPDSPQSLLLAGYVRLQKHGFALPCFATQPRPNTWYTAQTRIEGDRLSVISSFEEYAGAHVSPLPDELLRQMAVGDSWCDVFVWEEKPHLGNPTEIWDDLTPAIAAMDAHAPLSLFELSTNIGSQQRRSGAASVRKFLAHRHGTDVADHWRLSVARSAVQLRLRRLLPAARQPGAPVVDVELAMKPDGLHVMLPAALAYALFADPHCADWRDELAGFTADIGLDLREIAIIGAIEPEADPSQSDDPGPGPESRILILTAGRRAREIGRLVAEPGWYPVWSHESRPLKSPRVSVVDIHDRLDAWQAAEFDAVIILAGDVPDEAPIAADTFLSQLEVWSRPVLLAPVPDKHSATPSHAVRSGYPRLVRGIVDTSLARSPNWPDGSGRSIDRGIADLLVGVGMLLAGESPMDRALADWPGKRLPVLQYMTWAGSGPGHEGLLSELCGHQSPEAHWQAEFDIVSSKRSYKAKRGVCRLSTGDPDFPLLVDAVVRHAAGPDAPEEGSTQPPDDLLSAFGIEGPAAVQTLHNSPFTNHLMITGETPRLEQFEAALDRGFWLTRYTDIPTIRRHFSTFGGSSELPALPGEFLVGELKRLPENRGLATRGLDIRDVLTLTGPQHEEWSRISADHPWPDSIIRPYRAAIAHVPPMSKDDRQVAYVAPALEILEGLRTQDSIVEYLAELADWKEPRPSSGPWPKRLGDLEAVYAEPPATAARYVIADGDLPLRIAALDEREAPAQNLFLMAGDRAVPALALSRVFHVWTYATLSRSRGWPSRFTLGRTFESFPLPEGFLLGRHGPELAVLTVHPSAAVAEPLARLEHELQLRREWPEPWSNSVSRKPMDKEILRELLDTPLLGSYDLPPDASDLQIIRRLIEFNRYRSRH